MRTLSSSLWMSKSNGAPVLIYGLLVREDTDDASEELDKGDNHISHELEVLDGAGMPQWY